jgi:hypothetical protein
MVMLNERNLNIEKAIYYGEKLGCFKLAALTVWIVATALLWWAGDQIVGLATMRKGRAILIGASIGYVVMAVVFFERYPTIIFVAGFILGAVLIAAYFSSLFGGGRPKN